MKFLFITRNSLRALTRTVQLNFSCGHTLCESKNNKTNKAKNKMDEFSKTNPYFSKYEAKLKTMYK
jgi:hypothetical protein